MSVVAGALVDRDTDLAKTAALLPEELAFLDGRLPQAEVVVWRVGHHFPHLSDPARFAELLASFAAGVR